MCPPVTANDAHKEHHNPLVYLHFLAITQPRLTIDAHQ